MIINRDPFVAEMLDFGGFGAFDIFFIWKSEEYTWDFI